MIASLSAFGGVAAFVEEKFRDGIRIFVKVEICCFFDKLAIPHRFDVGFSSSLAPIKSSPLFSFKYTFSPPLKTYLEYYPIVLGIYFLPQFLRKLICGLKFVISFSLVGVVW